MKDETIKRSLEYSREKQKEYGWDSQAVQEGYLQGVLDATRWIPVEERLPDDYTCVLVRDNGFSPIRSIALYQDGQFYADFMLKNDDVTHWRLIEF